MKLIMVKNLQRTCFKVYNNCKDLFDFKKKNPYLIGLERFGGGESTAISESPAVSSFLTVLVGGGSSGAGAGGLGLGQCGLKISWVLLRGSTRSTRVVVFCSFGSSSFFETGGSSSDIDSSLWRLLVGKKKMY